MRVRAFHAVGDHPTLPTSAMASQDDRLCMTCFAKGTNGRRAAIGYHMLLTLVQIRIGQHDDGPQFRRGAARARLAAAHRQAPRRDAGELETGRGHHPDRRDHAGRSRQALSRLQAATAVD